MTPTVVKSVFLALIAWPVAWSHRERGQVQRSGASKASPGLHEECVRQGFSTAGDCGQMRLDGKKIQLKCYRPTTKNIAAAPAMGTKGTCYIPRKEPCGSGSGCRPGSICHHGWCLELQEVVTQSGDTAALIRDIADILRNEILTDGWSGIKSAFSSTSSASKLLSQIEKSFRTVHAEEHVNSSASGASFLYSGDGLFMAKKIPRAEEYQALSGKLIDALRGLSLECPEKDRTPFCWAQAALDATLLSLPVLAFKYYDDHWAVFPVAAALRSVTKDLQPTARPFGDPKYYDVKPFGANSRQRNGLVRRLTAMDFSPRSGSYSAAAQPANAQWKDVMNKLFQDLDLLEKSSYRPFVDYSLLFEVYRPGRRVHNPGTNCVSSRQCFEEEDGKSCQVVCVSIIDYFLRYETGTQKIESLLLNNKWDNYADKVHDMAKCLSHISGLSGPPGSVGTWIGTGFAMYATEDTQAPAKMVNEAPADGKLLVQYAPGPEPSADSCTQTPGARVYVRPGLLDPDQVLTCKTYLDMACFTGVPVECTSESFTIGGGSLTECAFQATGSVANGCRARLVSNCIKKVAAMSVSNYSSSL